MTADILTLHTALTPRVEASRRRAMFLHPSNFTPDSSAGCEGGQKTDELAARFECLHEDLMDRGLPEGEARTEVVRIAAREVWDGFASRLRRHRVAGDQMDANVLVVALSSIQGLTLSLVRHPGDLAYASRAVSGARRRLQFNGGLLDRLHPHANPAFSEADTTFQSLEYFLSQSQATAA
jgi:hypothetical protein